MRFTLPKKYLQNRQTNGQQIERINKYHLVPYLCYVSQCDRFQLIESGKNIQKIIFDPTGIQTLISLCFETQHRKNCSTSTVGGLFGSCAPTIFRSEPHPSLKSGENILQQYYLFGNLIEIWGIAKQQMCYQFTTE